MKKKVFGILSIVLTVVLMAGCNNGNVSATSSVDDTQPVIIEEPSVEPETPEPSEVVSEVELDPEPEPAEAEGDPRLVALEVTEEFAKENGLICLYRKGKLYSMGPYVPAQATYDYTIGWKQDDEKSALFSRGTMSGLGYGGDIIVYGDVPNIVIGEGDEVRDYGGTFVWPKTYDFAGYSPSIFKDEYGNVTILKYLNYLNPVQLSSADAQSVEILDASGNVVDFGNWPDCFKKHDKYTVTWYEGMSYNEHEMRAYSKVYFSNEEKVINYDPNFIATKEGYRIIDFSPYGPGMYATQETIPFTVE